MRRYCAILLCITVLSSRPALAGIELASSTGANFLTQGPGASLAAMGGAGLAGYGDLSAMNWNAASLGLMSDTQLMFTHMPLPNSATQEWMGFGGRMGATATRWAMSGRYEGDDAFVAKDPLGNPIGTFNSSSLALGINAARPLNEHTVIGIGGKFVNENLGNKSGYGGTMDFGILYRSGPLSLGVAGQNVGGSVKYDSLSYSMPRNIGGGFKLTDEKRGLSMSVDYNHQNAYYDDVRAGGEWMWNDRLALRVGGRYELNASPEDPMDEAAAGFGFGGRGMWMDYAFSVLGDGATQQRLTLRVSPKNWGFNSGTELDEPNSGTGSSAPATTHASNQAPANSPAPAAASSGSVATSSATSSAAPTAAPPASAPAKTKAAAPLTSAAATSTAAAAPAAAASAAAAKSPDLATLVPVTPPAAPAPKTVTASHPATMPAVSAPAAETRPSPSPGTVVESASLDTSSVAAAPTKGTGKPAVTASAAAAAEPTEAPVKSAVRADGKPVRIHVKKGETMESIARDYNTSAAAIMMENNLVETKVKAGMELKIPNHK